jgi:serine/threonine-protein kinase
MIDGNVDHPLLSVHEVADALEPYLAGTGRVFTEIRGHDSGNTSFGVEVNGERWFVKHATRDQGVLTLQSAIRFHGAVQHRRIVPMRGWLKTSDGLAVVHPWIDAEVLYDTLQRDSLPRDNPRSALARFRNLPIAEIVAALDGIIEAHDEVARQSFVAVDFYDGALMYDFKAQSIHLMDLDSYRPGPYVLERERQFGSTRFMAPEEWRRGATITEATTVYTLGRTAFVFLSAGLKGKDERDSWRASSGLYEVARRATAAEPEARYATVPALMAAWQEAARDSS